MEFISLIIWLLCGFACYKMAENKGYNKYLAGVLGVLFALIPVIVYACLSPKKN